MTLSEVEGNLPVSVPAALDSFWLWKSSKYCHTAACQQPTQTCALLPSVNVSRRGGGGSMVEMKGNTCVAQTLYNLDVNCVVDGLALVGLSSVQSNKSGLRHNFL